MVSSDRAADQEKLNLDDIYDAAISQTGHAPEIALFDTQLAGAFSTEWLIERAQIDEGVDRAEVELILADGLVRIWTDTSGKRGFIPYSSRQAGVFSKLRKVSRYELAELQHIAEYWNDYLEAVVIDEPPYDDRNVSDFEHFHNRVAETVMFFKEEVTRSSGSDDLAKERLVQWERIAEILADKSEQELTPSLRAAFQRQLWHLRWNDEFVRLMMASEFETQILLGYSTQVTFRRKTWHKGQTTLDDINWGSTFRRLRDIRREGLIFPLHMPEFDVTERGVALLSPTTPDQYSEMYSRHRMDEMFRVMREMGSDLWAPPPPPLGDSLCPACEQHFNRQSATQVYCSKRCRRRAINRRWREKDPERARRCQARYWKSYDDVN